MRIGVDLGGTKIEVIALDEGGGERFRERVIIQQQAHRHRVHQVGRQSAQRRWQGWRCGVPTRRQDAIILLI